MTRPDDQQEITVAVCTYDRYEHIPELMEALANQSLPSQSFTTLIVDNTGPGERQEEFLKGSTLPANARWMPSQPKGLSRARNAAAAACTTPFIAFVDDDARPEPQWLEAILSAFKADETLGVAFGPISLSWPDGPPDWLPTSIYPTIGALDLGPSDRKAASNERGYGGNLAFRTALIRDVGGFDERLGRSGARTLLSNDELGIQESIRARGWEIGYVAAARVHHKIAPDRVQANWFRGRIAWQAVSEVLQSADGLDTDAIRGLWDAVSSDNLLRWSHLLAPRRGETFAEQINSIHELVRLLLLTHLVDTTESHAILSEAYEKFVRAKGSAQAS